MGKNCEDVCQLLVELEYEELETLEEAEVRAHLKECGACRERREAYRAVRRDLREWDMVASPPSRIAFVTMPSPVPAARSGRGWLDNRWKRTAAVAASFILGLLLTAAAINLEIRSDADGWSVSTALLPSAPGAVGTPVAGGQGPAEAGPEATTADPTVPAARTVAADDAAGALAGPFADMSRADFLTWLEGTLAERGVMLVSTGSGRGLDDTDRAAVVSIVRGILDDYDSGMQQTLDDAMVANESRQQQQFAAALAEVYQTFQTQRANDLAFVTDQLGLMQQETGQELQLTNAALDYLYTQVASRADDRRPDAP